MNPFDNMLSLLAPGGMAAQAFNTARAPALIPSSDALPPTPYRSDLIAGRPIPVLPHQAIVTTKFADSITDLPPISSLFTRPYYNLTSG